MPSKSKKKHQQIDPVFKQVLEDELSPYNPDLQTEVEVSRMPRSIDAFVTVFQPNVLQNIHTETPFFYFLRCNQIEFKGRTDALTVSEYHLIRDRTHLWLGQHKTSPKEMVVTIVSARKPAEMMKYSKDLQQPFVPVEAGYYKQTKQPSVYLIVINELPIIPKNYPLLVFAASEEKFREFLEQTIKSGNSAYWYYAYAV